MEEKYLRGGGEMCSETRRRANFNLVKSCAPRWSEGLIKTVKMNPLVSRLRRQSAQAAMDSAMIMLKRRPLANVKMAGKPKGQGKTQVKARIHAN